MHQSLMDFLDGMLLITPAHQDIHAFAAHLDVREASLWFLEQSDHDAHQCARDLHAHHNIHAFAAHLDVRDVVIVHMHQSLMDFLDGMLLITPAHQNIHAFAAHQDIHAFAAHQQDVREATFFSAPKTRNRSLRRASNHE
jgi:hypothetical protein